MTRRVLALECAVLLALTLLMWGVSYFQPEYGTPTYKLDMFGGNIRLSRSIYWWWNQHLEPAWRSYGLHFETYWMPRFSSEPGYWRIKLPLWIPTVIFGGLSAYLYIPIWRRQRRARVGACLYCGYNLTGNLSGICPECGKGVCRDELPGRIGKRRAVALVLAPIAIVVGPMVFLTVKNAMGEPDESLVQRMYSTCSNQGRFSIPDPTEMHRHISTARNSELTREELIADWDKSYPVVRYIPDCINAVIDAGFDIAERWDGRPESERVKTSPPDEEEER